LNYIKDNYMSKKHHEQTFCTALKKWLHYHWHETCAIEAKISLGDKPLNLKSGFKPHQLPTLLAIKAGPFEYKISDLDRMPKPFDLLLMHQAKSYVAIHWVRKGNRTFYLIDPLAIQGLIDDGYKSIDEKIAMVICEHIGALQ